MIVTLYPVATITWAGSDRSLTGSLAPSGANIDITSERHLDSSSMQGNESVDWEISSSSLMREIIQTTNEDMGASLLISVPARPPSSPGSPTVSQQGEDTEGGGKMNI